MVFITAEIGINHNGDIDIAKKLIDIAVKAKCDAVKFQKRTVESLYPQEFLDSQRESPWGTTQKEQKLGLEFNKKEYDEINDYCKKKNIIWYASSWDIESLYFLQQYDLKYNKVPSAMLIHHKLLRIIAEEKKHTFISTGMSSMEQIRDVVKIFREYKCPFELQHSVATYPMKPDEANLRCIQTLRKEFDCDVGYSGHEVGSYLICVAAVLFGAISIERHITLDRSMYGSDQAASLEPLGLERLVKDIRELDKILGDGVKKVWPAEIPIIKKLRKDVNLV